MIYIITARVVRWLFITACISLHNYNETQADKKNLKLKVRVAGTAPGVPIHLTIYGVNKQENDYLQIVLYYS